MERVVFIDTNVFESASFSYTTPNFEKLLSLCRENEISICITDVVKNEVIKRIKTNLEDILKIEKQLFNIIKYEFKLKDKNEFKNELFKK